MVGSTFQFNCHNLHSPPNLYTFLTIQSWSPSRGKPTAPTAATSTHQPNQLWSNPRRTEQRQCNRCARRFPSPRPSGWWTLHRSVGWTLRLTAARKFCSNKTSEKNLVKPTILSTIVVAPHMDPFFGLDACTKNRRTFFGESLFVVKMIDSEQFIVESFGLITSFVAWKHHKRLHLDTVLPQVSSLQFQRKVSVPKLLPPPNELGDQQKMRTPGVFRRTRWKILRSFNFVISPGPQNLQKCSEKKKKHWWNTKDWLMKIKVSKNKKKQEKHVLSRSISWSDLCMHSSGLHRRRHHDEIGVNTEELMHASRSAHPPSWNRSEFSSRRFFCYIFPGGKKMLSLSIPTLI